MMFKCVCNVDVCSCSKMWCHLGRISPPVTIFCVYAKCVFRHGDVAAVMGTFRSSRKMILLYSLRFPTTEGPCFMLRGWTEVPSETVRPHP